mgnify:FL=1
MFIKTKRIELFISTDDSAPLLPSIEYHTGTSRGFSITLGGLWLCASVKKKDEKSKSNP